MVCYRDDILDRPAFINKSVVDAIGAGDSFNAGFIYKFIKGNPIPECQEFGNLTGAVSTLSSGGTAAFRDYEAFREKARNIFGFTI